MVPSPCVPVRVFPILLAVGLLLFAGCQSETVATDSTDEVEFLVSEELLGSAFEDGALSVRPPSGWNAVPREILDQATEDAGAGSSEDPRETPRMLAMFLHESQGAVLGVSCYDAPVSSAELESLITLQHRGLQEADPAADVSASAFSHQGTRFRQLMSISADFVLFKIFTSSDDGRLYQLDYRVPRPWYRENLGLLESSIGSITVQHPQQGE